MAVYHPEKVVVEFGGRKKIVREEKSFCGYCRDFQPKVFLKPDFWPSDLRSSHEELSHTVHLCLECRTATYDKGKASRLQCYEKLRIAVLEKEEKLSVRAVADSILAT